MELFNPLFRKLTFTQLEQKEGYAIYGAATGNMMGGDQQRFVLVFVPAHLGVLSECNIDQLDWVNIQTRHCPKTTYRIKPQYWKFPDNAPNCDLKVVERTKSYTKYVSEEHGSEFDVLLLHSPKKKTIYQYPNTTNMHWAIDRFETVVTLNKDVSQHQVYPSPPPASNPLQHWVEKTSTLWEYI